MQKPPHSYKPVILVTGCSTGIGFAIAKLLYSIDSYRLVLTARPSSLEVVNREFPTSDRVWVAPLDVTSSADRKILIHKIQEKWNGVDILVNNAGVSFRSTVEEMDEESEQLQMETNYHGPIELIKLCLPQMRKVGRGKIINVSSVSGMLAMPTMSSYSASKHALEGASEALWYEARPFGINVSLIAPGFVRSNSYTRVKYSKKSFESRNGNSPYSKMYTSMEPFISRLMNRGLSTPESIAKLVVLVIRTQDPPLWIPASYDAEFFYYLRRFFSRRILSRILYRLLPNVTSWGENFTRKRNHWIWPLNIVRNWWQNRRSSIR
ncbi:MAG: SDR family NAD(P)-dependent oxidoreductase [Bdellovibrionales bacterium]|nr:SDR family NAD(P)-dependent oxidoreductase [Bdellovibrionales bacterium]